MHIKTKIIVFLLPVIAAAFVIFAGFSDYIFKNHMESLVYEDLNDISTSQKYMIMQVVESNTMIFDLLAKNKRLIDLVDKYNKNPSADILAELTTSINDTAINSRFADRITIADLTGNIITSTNEKLIATTYSTQPIELIKTKTNIELFSLEHDNIVTSIAGPILLNGQVIGILNIDLIENNFIKGLYVHPGLGTTGESILIKPSAAKNQYTFLHITKSDSGVFNVQRNEVNINDLSFTSLKNLLDGAANSFINYKGNESLGVVQDIPDIGWTLITFIEKDEAYHSIHKIQWYILFGFMILLVILGLILQIISVSITQPIKRLTSIMQKYKNSKVLDACPIFNSPEVELLAETLQETVNSLQYQSEHDLLTELPNRRYISTAISNLLNTAKNQLDSKFAIFFIQLHGISIVNESFGHACGDQLLQAVALRLKELTAKNIVLTRFEGDQFIAIIKPYDTVDELIAKANVMLNLLSQPFTIEKRIFKVNAYIGITQYPQDALTTDNLLQFADIAMIVAKESKVSSYKFYDEEISQKIQRTAWLKNELAKAIQDKTLEMYYQPQIDVSTNTIIGIEALMRWKHPTAGFISPDEFIDLAEKNSMSHELSELAVWKSYRDFSKLQSAGILLKKMSINLSIQAFERIDLAKYLLEYAQQFNIPIQHITFEITESIFMSDALWVMSVVAQLKNLGFSIALDDFGKGFSSLSILYKLPIDMIKIDKIFIDDVGEDHNNNNKNIVLMIIDLAKRLEKQILAEGVETIEQVSWLHEHGCNMVQGYFFAHPMPLDELIEFFNNWPTGDTAEDLKI